MGLFVSHGVMPAYKKKGGDDNLKKVFRETINFQ